MKGDHVRPVARNERFTFGIFVAVALSIPLATSGDPDQDQTSSTRTVHAMPESSNMNKLTARELLESGRGLAWFHSHTPLVEDACWREPVSNPSTATVIDCRGRDLQGTIPPLSALTALTGLYLDNNQLQGPIPPLSELSAITRLYLDNNQLQGPIPPLGALTALTGLYLNNNQLQGPIPPLNALAALTGLYLNNNQLQGIIPPFSALTALTGLNVGSNQLQGPIPPLSALTALTGLDLGDNQLQGPVPPLSALTALMGLWLNDNRLSGALADLSHLTYLRDVGIKNSGLLGGVGTNCINPIHSPNILVAGAVARSSKMGFYSELEITSANDYMERDGRPAFYGAATGAYLYYLSSTAGWNIGAALGSQTLPFLHVQSTAVHPLDISASAQWREYDGSSWFNPSVVLSCAPADRCVPGSAYAPSLTGLYASIETCEGCSACITGCSVCTRCAAGRISRGGGAPCEDCPVATYCLEGTATSAPCPAGTYGNVVGLTTADCAGRCAAGDHCPPASVRPGVCRAGYYCPNSTVELPCAAGSVSSKGATACEACTEGKKANADRTLCELCELGEWAAPASSSCSPCPGGRYGGALELGAASACTACDSGKFSDGSTACALCPAGKHSNADLSACEACPVGRHSAFTGLGAAAECTPCVPGRFGVARGARSAAEGCAPCNGGTYQDQAGSTACKVCESGHVSEGGQARCRVCEPGTVPNEEATACNDCDPGSYAKFGDTACITCADGTVAQYSRTAFCTFCKQGEYASEGHEACSKCPAGSWCSSGIKMPCPAGKFSDVGQAQCKACDPGSVPSSSGLSCQACDPGSYARFSDTSCKTCANGTVAPNRKTVFCALCSEGYYANEQSTGCLVCPAGSRCVAGIRQPCKAGTASPVKSSHCEMCTAGTVLVGNNCMPCPAGTISKAGATECTPCSNGTFADESGSECLACAAGRFGETEGLTTSECSGLCPSGSHSFRYATTCMSCEVGKYQPRPGQEACLLCPDHRTSEAGATACGCETGRYEDEHGVCSLCIEGMDCGQAGTVLRSMHLTQGHWRPGGLSAEVLMCPSESSCNEDGNCTKGNEGVLCAVCMEGYYRVSLSLPCEACGDRRIAALSAVGALLGAILVVSLILFINRRAPNGLLRPFINLVQQLTVMLMFKAPFPQAMRELYKVLSSVTLGVQVVSPQCVGLSTTFYSRFGIVVLSLTLLCLSLMLGPILKSVREGRSLRETLASPSSAGAMRDLFVVVLLLHPSVSGMAMDFFRCRTIDGRRYLMADYSLLCYDDAWYAFLPLVLFVLFFYSLGTPASIALILHARREKLYDADSNVIEQPLDILYAVYRADVYYFEAVQMVFKLALWSTLVFFEHGSEMQLATALVVNVVQLCVHIEAKPMGGSDSVLLNTMQTCTLVLTTYINFGAMSMNYLAVSKELAQHLDQSRVGYYNARIVTIGVVMEVLTFVLFLSFGIVAIKNFVTKVGSIGLRGVRNRVVVLFTGSTRSKSTASNQDDTARVRGGTGGAFSLTNPMHDEPDGLTRGCNIELTVLGSKEDGEPEISVGKDDPGQLSKPGDDAAHSRGWSSVRKYTDGGSKYLLK